MRLNEIYCYKFSTMAASISKYSTDQKKPNRERFTEILHAFLFPFCIRSVPVLFPFCIRSVSVLFAFAFPVRFLLIGTVMLFLIFYNKPKNSNLGSMACIKV